MICVNNGYSECAHTGLCKPITMPSPQKEGWEEGFDNLRNTIQLNNLDWYIETINFIRQERRTVAEEMLEAVTKGSYAASEPWEDWRKKAIKKGKEFIKSL